jgi:ATP-dependent exoDNAse (exonuclease V) alpha subunit
MAIFHLNAKVISRGKGQSAIAAAAYRSGERLRDEQADEQKFYKARAERIMFTDIMAPKDAPEWAHDRNQLWNQAERAEKRKDAQLAREIEISLPHELTEQQREWLVKDFAREAFVRKGYAVDIAIHAPDKTSDDRNHHAHLMVTMRSLGPEGFAATKDRSLNSKEQMVAWREQWAHLANRHLERHGHEARIDHRSLAARGIDQEPTIHLGYAANEIAQRGGQSDRMDQLRGVLERNEIRLDMKALDRELKELTRQVEKAAPIDKGLRVIDNATGVVGKLGDFIIDLLAGASPARDAETDMGAFVSDPAARKAQQLARLEAKQQERQAQAALERMEDDMKAGKALAASDIQALTRAQQETIRAFGDDAVRQMVEDAQRRAERYWKGEERERDR